MVQVRVWVSSPLELQSPQVWPSLTVISSRDSLPAGSVAVTSCVPSAGRSTSRPSVNSTGVPFTVTVTGYASVMVRVTAAQYTPPFSAPVMEGAVASSTMPSERRQVTLPAGR